MPEAVWGLVGLVVGVAIGFLFDRLRRGAAFQGRDEIIKQAEQEAENLKRSHELATKEELLKRREDLEKELTGSREELRKQEKRLDKREATLDDQQQDFLKKDRMLETTQAKLADRGKAYGISGEEVDGMDVVAVRDAAGRALKHAREKGPYILEMKTYRYRGHSMSDPAKYRTKDEVNKMRQEHDPIDMVRQLLVDGGVSEDQLKGIDREIKDIVTDAADFAQSSPEPDPSELFTEILVEA